MNTEAQLRQRATTSSTPQKRASRLSTIVGDSGIDGLVGISGSALLLEKCSSRLAGLQSELFELIFT
jgi:hypothetical protein